MLKFEGLCEVMLDGETSHHHKLPSHHTGAELFPVASDPKEMHSEFLQLFKLAISDLLGHTLFKNLVAPLADLFPLLLNLPLNAEGTLLGSRVKLTAIAARGERRMTERFD